MPKKIVLENSEIVTLRKIKGFNCDCCQISDSNTYLLTAFEQKGIQFTVCFDCIRQLSNLIPKE